MKKLYLVFLFFNSVFLFSQDFERSRHILMGRDEAVRHFLSNRNQRGFYVMYAHFVQMEQSGSRTQLTIYTHSSNNNNHVILSIDSNPSIPNLSIGTVVRVYYWMGPVRGGSTPTFIVHIEPADKRFIIGHVYNTFVNLNVRTEPSISASRITTIPQHSRVTVLEEGPEVIIDGIESSWVRVRFGSDQEGWVFGGYIEYWVYWLDWINRPEEWW